VQRATHLIVPDLDRVAGVPTMTRVFGAKLENASTLETVSDTHAAPFLRSPVSARQVRPKVVIAVMLRIAEFTHSSLLCALVEVLDHMFALVTTVFAGGHIIAQQHQLTKILPVKLLDAVLVKFVVSTLQEKRNVFTIIATPLPVEKV